MTKSKFKNSTPGEDEPLFLLFQQLTQQPLLITSNKKNRNRTQKSRVVSCEVGSEDPSTSLTLVITDQGELQRLKIEASARDADTKQFVIERAPTPPAVVTASLYEKILN